MQAKVAYAEEIKQEPLILTNLELISQYAKKYGNNERVSKNIATCESRLHQFNADGTVLKGKVNPKDIGLFQVNEKYHLADSRKLGMNIYEREGNVEYAMWLMSKQGTVPWNASKFCWQGK